MHFQGHDNMKILNYLVLDIDMRR